MNQGLFSHRLNQPHRKPALPLAFASDLPGITAFPGAVAGVSLLSYFIMDSRYLVHRRFRVRLPAVTFRMRIRPISGDFYCVRHSACSFRFVGHWYSGIFHYYIRFMRYEIGISKLPF